MHGPTGGVSKRATGAFRHSLFRGAEVAIGSLRVRLWWPAPRLPLRFSPPNCIAPASRAV